MKPIRVRDKRIDMKYRYIDTDVKYRKYRYSNKNIDTKWPSTCLQGAERQFPPKSLGRPGTAGQLKGKEERGLLFHILASFVGAQRQWDGRAPSGTPFRIFEADPTDLAGTETLSPPGSTDQWPPLPLFEQMNASYVSMQRECSEPQMGARRFGDSRNRESATNVSTQQDIGTTRQMALL
ncbi:hypothetical protein DPX16_15769 [Anabarilius grahami]|uniref:Uncharacterized protein n=1 Tax=Anabarilius grahami TaxID=495550 RepID=A0A3N0YTC0_ANAGA|nr:hypothetical protein DPX16_15769 [Anabarilius grahami]